MLEHLRTALAGRGFLLFAQPMASLGTADRVAHFEVLLRLAGDDGTILPPACFIPMAERHGLMPQIDRWVLRNALAWCALHRHRLPEGVCLALNLAAQSLADDAFLDDLVAEVDSTSIDPAGLIFEITETEAIADLPRVSSMLGALREFGCRTALDDFGTGYCSFHYLKELPIDFLKAAGNFVRLADESSIDLTLVAAMQGLGRELGIRTVAECVETPAVLRTVRELGMDFAQGYAISAPFPIERVLPS